MSHHKIIRHSFFFVGLLMDGCRRSGPGDSSLKARKSCFIGSETWKTGKRNRMGRGRAAHKKVCPRPPFAFIFFESLVTLPRPLSVLFTEAAVSVQRDTACEGGDYDSVFHRAAGMRDAFSSCMSFVGSLRGRD